MVAIPTILSADDYLATDRERPRFTELIHGEVCLNTPSLRHQRIGARIQFLLQLWCEQAPGRGEAPLSVDAKLSDGDVYAPDVWWVCEANRPARDAKHLVGPPDLAVEIRSPSTWRFDVGMKFETYERANLPELWLVDTASNSILVYRRSSPAAKTFDVALEFSEGERLTSPMLPGLSVDITALFDR